MLQYLNQFIVVQRDLVFWGWPTERSVRNNHRSLFNNQRRTQFSCRQHVIQRFGVCQQTPTDMLFGTVIVNDVAILSSRLDVTDSLILVSVTKLALSVFVALWIRESGLGFPTHVRANSKPAASRAPPKALTSQARIGQVRLVAFHTRPSLIHWNSSPAVLVSQTRTCMGQLRLGTHWQLNSCGDKKVAVTVRALQLNICSYRQLFFFHCRMTFTETACVCALLLRVRKDRRKKRPWVHPVVSKRLKWAVL
jgi:hypothetical protein